MNRQARVLHTKFGENFPCLFQDGGAVIRRNPRLERDFDSAAVARFKRDMHVGSNFRAPMDNVTERKTET